MKILAIETSCDETAIALVEVKGGLKNPQFKIFKNLVASQIKIHRPYGGVVPNLAKREHLKNLPILYRQVFANSKSKINPSGILRKQNIDLIAVTVGPGLEPALWTGINFTKELYAELRGITRKKKLEIIGVSHLEGHLYSFLLSYRDCFASLAMTKNIFPAVALIISGGHTILLLMKDLTHYKKLGETRDDAVGEAFDKVARLLNLPYPGGPEIEKLAKHGNPDAINFPRPMINQKNYDFSFSGLKTSVLYYLRDLQNNSAQAEFPRVEADKRGYQRGITRKNLISVNQRTHQRISAAAADIAAAFQAAAFDVLIYKTLRAAKEFKAKSILVSGGVASNLSLKKDLKLRIKNEELRINLFVPPKKFCLDNAVIIAVSGYINYLRSKKRRLIAQGNLGL